MGKLNFKETRKSSSMIVTSLLMPNMSISDMWSLHILGIKYSVSLKLESDPNITVVNHFITTVRYEVPWIEDNLPIPNNLEMAKKRLREGLTILTLCLKKVDTLIVTKLF